MALEIERKFLVNVDLLPKGIEGKNLSQGYLLISDQKSIRARISGEKAFITIKGPDTNGTRSEFEYEIPINDAEYMLANFCNQPVISKIRYRINRHNQLWEVDEFLGANQGLWLAEIELRHREDIIEIPPWLGKEVTFDNRFFNTYISLHPYNTWADKI